jgi:hypothetical protein
VTQANRKTEMSFSDQEEEDLANSLDGSLYEISPCWELDVRQRALVQNI